MSLGGCSVVKKIIKFTAFVISFLFLALSSRFSANTIKPVVAANILKSEKSDLDFSIESDSTNPAIGEKFSVDLNFLPSKELNISVFRFKLNFDTKKLKYTGFYSQYGEENFKVNLEDDSLTAIFLTNEKGVNIAGGTKNTFLEINFKVLTNAEPSSSSFNATLDGLANYNVERLSLSKGNCFTEVKIEEKPKVNCNLSSLLAENYTLSPSFSGEITDYSVTVPASKSSLYVLALPEDDKAIVAINRTTLNGEGKKTDIKIVVTGSDRKSRKTYKIHVNRLKKTEKNSTFVGPKSNWSNVNYIGSSGADSSGALEEICIIGFEINFMYLFAVIFLCILLLVLILRRRTYESFD